MVAAIGDKASEWKDRAADWGSQALEQTSTSARNAGMTIRRTYYANPLPIGLAAVGLGALAGILIPGTGAEDRWMGETRDRLADQATDRVQVVASKVQSVAQEAVEAAQERAAEEAKNQGLTTAQPAQ